MLLGIQHHNTAWKQVTDKQVTDKQVTGTTYHTVSETRWQGVQTDQDWGGWRGDAVLAPPCPPLLLYRLQ